MKAIYMVCPTGKRNDWPSMISNYSNSWKYGNNERKQNSS